MVAVSARWAEVGAVNRIAQVRAELVATGRKLVDLTDSNPTRHGLLDQRVLAAVARASTRAALYDADTRGPLAAREALAAYLGGSPNQYWLTSSTSEAYSWLFTLFSDPGQAIANPAPGYPLIEPLAHLADLTTLPYPSHYLANDGWSLDLERFTRTIQNPACRAVVVVNPGNPTGAYLAGQTKQALVSACAQAGQPIIADEVFNPFSLTTPAAANTLGDQAKLVPATLTTPAAANTFGGQEEVVTATLGGLSKLLAAPQLKLSWIHLSGPADQTKPLATALDQIADTFLPVNGPVAAALPDLLKLANPVVASIRHRLLSNLVTSRQILSQTGWRVRRTDGGWTVLVDLPPGQLHSDDDDLIIELMRHHDLAVHPGWFYDLTTNGTLAISLLPQPDTFAENLHRLRFAVGQTETRGRGNPPAKMPATRPDRAKAAEKD